MIEVSSSIILAGSCVVVALLVGVIAVAVAPLVITGVVFMVAVLSMSTGGLPVLVASVLVTVVIRCVALVSAAVPVAVEAFVFIV